MRLAALTLVLLAASLSPVSSASAAASPAPDAAPTAGSTDRFAGSYAYVGGEAQRAALDAAIDQAVKGMFFAIRGIARGRLHDNTEIKTTIGFRFAGGNITSTANGEAPATSPESGAWTPFKAGAENLKLSQKLTAQGHLVQTFVAAEGSRTNDYVLSADGKVLTASITLRSEKLSAPLHYILTYKKR